MNKYFLSSAALIFSLGTQSASAEYMCDLKSYQTIQDAQYNEEGQFVGTSNDGCRNYKAAASDEYKAGAEPTDAAKIAATTDLEVFVVKYIDHWLFIPNHTERSNIKNAVLIVPGGNVDSASYAPLARAAVKQISQGSGNQTMAVIMRYPSVVYPSEPCNVMADGFINTIRSVHRQYNDGIFNENIFGIRIDNWVTGGHSEGGVAMSSFLLQQEYVNEKDNNIRGSFYLASFPILPSPGVWPESNYCALSMAGQNDLVLNQTGYIAAKRHHDFPPQTIYYDMTSSPAFRGGIHSYMGDYCPLTPDPSADNSGMEPSAELQYYEVYPEPTVHQLLISRPLQQSLIYGDSGIVLNFAAQALSRDFAACQSPLSEINGVRLEWR